MKCYSILAITFFALLSHGNLVNGADMVSKIEDKDISSMAFIVVYNKNDPSKVQSQGSGLLLDEGGWVLTAKHIVGMLTDSENITVSVLANNNQPLPVDRTDIPCAKYADICLVRIPVNNTIRAQVPKWYKGLLSCYTPDQEDSLRALRSSNNLFSGVEQYTGKVTGSQMAQPRFPTDIPVVAGLNGGPVFDVKKRIIGIMGEPQDDSGRHSLIPLERAASVFLDLKIPCLPEKPSSQDTARPREVCQYRRDRIDYTNCMFDFDARFQQKINPEGFIFKNVPVNSLPEWIKKGLDIEGVYAQKRLIHEVKKRGFKNLKEAHLSKADFREADLESVNFNRAYLRQADFSGAKINGAIFKDADLQDATWTDGQRCQAGSISTCDK